MPVRVQDNIGHVLTSGGGWARGATGQSGTVTVTVEAAFLTVTPANGSNSWADYGWDLRFTLGEEAPSVHRIQHRELEANVEAWMKLPSAPSGLPEVQRCLRELAEEVADARSRPHFRPYPGSPPGNINGTQWTKTLCGALLRRPEEGSLLAWLRDVLPKKFAGYTRTVGDVRFELMTAEGPWIGLGEFGTCSLKFKVGGFGAKPVEGFLNLGRASLKAFDVAAPTDAAVLRDLDQMFHTARAWLDANLEVRGPQLKGAEDLFQAFEFFPGHLPLAELIEQRIQQGPPGAPPVAPWTDGDFSRAASLVSRVDLQAKAPRKGVAEAIPFASFVIQDWKVDLLDHLSGAPHSVCRIWLTPPGEAKSVTVMQNDVWSPRVRLSVDGDAFAFRRFVSWLREGILRAGLDRTVTFIDPEPDFDLPEHEQEPSRVDVKISDWLRFGIPDFGDCFLVDWRGQWDIVNAAYRIEDFASIYGYSPEYLAELRQRDIPLWRKFLHDVVDARFPLER